MIRTKLKPLPNPLGLKPPEQMLYCDFKGTMEYARTICAQIFKTCMYEKQVMFLQWYITHTKLPLFHALRAEKRCKAMPPEIFTIDFDADRDILAEKLKALIIALHHGARIFALKSFPFCHRDTEHFNEDAILQGAKHFIDYDLLYLNALKHRKDYEITGPSTNTYSS